MTEIGLRELQQIELNLLIEFDEVCKKHDLRYYIDGGTLLGAMCYEGFIPWDDDIDLKMPRPDYEKLLTLEGEFPDYIRLDPPTAGHCEYTMLKLIDDRTLLIEMNNGVEKHTGVYLDIFPMDGYPDDGNREEHLKKLRKYNTLFHHALDNFAGTGRRRSLSSRIKGNIYRLIYSPWTLYRKLDHEAKKYDYDSASSVGLLIEGDAYKERFDKKWLMPGFTLEFEGRRFPAPSGYREHLARFYGEHVLNPDYYHNLPMIKPDHRHKVYWKEGYGSGKEDS